MVLTAIGACGGADSQSPTAPGAAVTALQITGVPAGPLTVGQGVRLIVMATTSAGTIDVTTQVLWSPANTSVAVVSGFGLLTATGVGETDIMAVYQSLSAAFTARVEPPVNIDERFKVAILAMDTRGDPRLTDVERIFARASSIFQSKTGVSLSMIDYRPAPPGVPLDQARAYFANLAPGRPIPSGILAYSDDTTAVTYGGYAQAFQLPAPYENPFPVLNQPANRAYLAVSNYSHIYSRCGYDNQGARIGERSANGECRGQSGLICVDNGRNWVCPNSQADLYAEDDYYAACTIVHELAHPFGPAGNDDHYGTPQCRSRTGMSATQAGDVRLSQSSCGLCPDVYAAIHRR